MLQIVCAAQVISLIIKRSSWNCVKNTKPLEIPDYPVVSIIYMVYVTN